MTAQPSDWSTFFGADKRAVSGYALTDVEAVSRILLPGQSWPAGTRWADLAADRGVTLSGETVLADIGVDPDARGSDAPGPPYGSVEPSTRDALLAVLDRTMGLAAPAGFALWVGYAENHPGQAGPGEPDEAAAAFCPQGGVLSFAAGLGALARFDEHWPIAVWTTDMRFAIAQPIYGGSLYASSTAEVAEALRADPGLEVFEIGRDHPVPPGS